MDHDANVTQFMTIAGCSVTTAAQYLQVADDNIESALQLYYESGGAGLGQEDAGPSRPEAPQDTQRHPTTSSDTAEVVRVDSDDDDDDAQEIGASNHGGNRRHVAVDQDSEMARRLQEEMYSSGGTAGPEEVRAPMGRVTETLVGGPEEEYGHGPISHAALFNQFRQSQQQGRSSRRGIFNQHDSSAIWSDGNSSPSASASASSPIASKHNRLAEMYRPPFEIISNLPWDSARDHGREEKKWLLVNIQDPKIFDCQLLNRDLWKNPEIVETIRNNFIFLQYIKDDPRASPYLTFYFQDYNNDDNYPHTSILDPRTGEQVRLWSGRPVVTPSEFLEQIHAFLDQFSLQSNSKNPVVVPGKQPTRPKPLDAMTEDEQIAFAMSQSMGVPYPPQDETTTKTETAAESETEGDTGNEDESSKKPPEAEEEEEVSPQMAIFRHISSDRPHTEPEPDAATTTRIQFRHPNGRVIRRFALSDPVRRLYEWLKAAPIDEDKRGVPFELVSLGQNLVERLDASVADAGLKNGTVMVGYLEE